MSFDSQTAGEQLAQLQPPVGPRAPDEELPPLHESRAPRTPDEELPPLHESRAPQTPGADLARLEETVQRVPVLSEVRAVAPVAAGALPAVQAVAVAATSFAAGAATLALVRRHGDRKRLKRAARLPARRGEDGFEIVASRRFMVDIHLLDRPSR
jgi:hypothetical protein